MMLPKRILVVAPQPLQVGGTGLLGQTISTILDRTYPLEELIVHVDIQMGGTALTPAGVDQILGILKNVQININDGVTPRSQVNYSGMGLLERQVVTGQGLDADTKEVVAAAGALAANGAYRINYRVPIVHPQLNEPIRSRAMLPMHLWTNDQVLVLAFEQAANMYSAGVVTSIVVSFTMLQRIVTPAFSAAIVGNGGFLKTDLIETPYTVPLGYTGAFNPNIPTPGSYGDLLFRHYRGGASITRDEISALTQTTGFGNETIWSIVTGQTALHSFRMKNLRTMNDYGNFLPRDTTALRPGGLINANTSFCTAASVLMDFLIDGCAGGDGASELGSVLNCNIAANSGLQMQLQGQVASVATNASVIWIGGFRFYGDITNYQQLK